MVKTKPYSSKALTKAINMACNEYIKKNKYNVTLFNFDKAINIIDNMEKTDWDSLPIIDENLDFLPTIDENLDTLPDINKDLDSLSDINIDDWDSLPTL